MADAGYLLKEHTAMPGERNLAALLQNMTPEMHEGVIVFCNISEDKEIPATLRPIPIFRECEGTLSSYGVRKPKAPGSPINLHRE